MRPEAVQTPDEIRGLIDGYIRSVTDGSRVVGKFERLCVERHLRDLAAVESGERPDLQFSDESGMHFLQFAVRCRHTKAEWAGRRFRFNEKSSWMAFVCYAIFGWLKYTDQDGWIRRFQSVFLCLARKNGKTMIAAIIGLYLFAFDGEAASQVFFAATKREQAREGWDQAWEIVEHSKELKKLIKVTESRSMMSIPDGSKCAAVGRDRDGLDGKHVHGGMVDETHLHKDRTTRDILESGTAARRQPLMVDTTTCGSTRKGLCWDLYHDAQRILEGAITDDSTFAFIAALDDTDDWADQRVWPKANPNLGVSVKLSYLQQQCQKARNNIGYLNEFRRKHCNQWTEANTAWMAYEKWKACSGTVNPETLKGRRCYAGLDLSATADVTALVLVFPPIGEETQYQVLPYFWIPADTVPERVKSDRVPFNIWVEQGYVIETPGPVIDQDAVKVKLLNLREWFDIREIAMDPYEGHKISTELLDYRFEVVKFTQRASMMSPAIKDTERLILTGNLLHGDNPCMNWMMTNISMHMDAFGNIRFDKDRSADRIDGPVSMVMGVGRAAAHASKPKPRVYAMEDTG